MTKNSIISLGNVISKANYKTQDTKAINPPLQIGLQIFIAFIFPTMHTNILIFFIFFRCYIDAMPPWGYFRFHELI